MLVVWPTLSQERVGSFYYEGRCTMGISVENNIQQNIHVVEKKELKLQATASQVQPDIINKKTSEEIKNLVRQNTSYLINVNFDLNVSYDRGANRLIFTVVDKNTGEMVQKIPNEIVLNITRGIKEKVEAMFIDQRR